MELQHLLSPHSSIIRKYIKWEQALEVKINSTPNGILEKVSFFSHEKKHIGFSAFYLMLNCISLPVP